MKYLKASLFFPFLSIHQALEFVQISKYTEKPGARNQGGFNDYTADVSEALENNLVQKLKR